MPEPISPTEQDIELLRRDKYEGAADADMTEDIARLAAGEPLAYVIGWMPFLGAAIHLDSRPLIPRPETEYWTEQLIDYLRYRFNDTPFTLLDLCAGSGAIGISILKHLPNAHVSFGEIYPEHTEQIKQNLVANSIDDGRADVRTGSLFEPFDPERFNVIASNPPYIPADRTLERSVTDFEPHDALYSGADGLDLIKQIAQQAPDYLLPDGELWMECDVSNINEAHKLLLAAHATEAIIHADQYGRERFIVGRFK